MCSLQVLLNAGADIHAQDVDGNTPMHHVAMEGHIDTLTQLLQEGSNINGKNYARRTPIHFAALKGKLACVKALVAKRASIHVPDASGHLPIILFCKGKPHRYRPVSPHSEFSIGGECFQAARGIWCNSF